MRLSSSASSRPDGGRAQHGNAGRHFIITDFVHRHQFDRDVRSN